MNGNKVKAGFEKQLLNLKLDQILPLKTIKANLKSSQKYKRILSSVEEVGIIEPLVVCPQNGKRGDGATYHLLDGHLRYEVLIRVWIDGLVQYHRRHQHRGAILGREWRDPEVRALDRGRHQGYTLYDYMRYMMYFLVIRKESRWAPLRYQ